MEIVILVVLGILALTIIGLRIWRTVKGFTQDKVTNKCTVCGSCCSPEGERKE